MSKRFKTPETWNKHDKDKEATLQDVLTCAGFSWLIPTYSKLASRKWTLMEPHQFTPAEDLACSVCKNWDRLGRTTLLLICKLLEELYFNMGWILLQN